MFAFLKKIKIPKTTLYCLAIIAIVLIILFVTNIINQKKVKNLLGLEPYEDDSCPPGDKSIACNIKRAYNIATS